MTFSYPEDRLVAKVHLEDGTSLPADLEIECRAYGLADWAAGLCWGRHPAVRADAMDSCCVRAAVEAAAPLIAAQVLEPGHVVVNADDLETLLNQRMTHGHQRPGIWDDDNRPGVAGTRCVECAARGRLRAALRGNGRERSLTPCPLCGDHGMNFAKCARCGKQADPPRPCPHCGRTSHGFAGAGLAGRSLTEDAP